MQKEAITPQLIQLRRVETQKLAIEKRDGHMPSVMMSGPAGGCLWTGPPGRSRSATGRRTASGRGKAPTWSIIYRTELKGLPLELGLYAKPNAEPRRVYELIGQLQLLGDEEKKVYPLLFAPYISQRASQLCRQAGIGCFDEIGNCWISYRTILISKSVEGKPPAPRRESRRLFAPKSLRIVRALLCQPLKDWRQLALSKETGTSLGLVNRVVRRLQGGAYVTLIAGRSYLKDRQALLAEWVKAETLRDKPHAEYYTSEPLQQFEQRLDELSVKKGFQYALTLFAGARYRAPFVRANRLHAYVRGGLESIASELDLKAVPSGGNCLIFPAQDEGVFFRRQRVQNRNIVSDVQLYVDLKNAHGRGEEQAEALAERCLQPILRENIQPVQGERTIEQEAKLHEFLRLRDQGDARLFRSNDAAAAADALGRAMEMTGALSPADRDRELDFLRIKLWLARLEAAFRAQNRTLLQGAISIFPVDHDVEELRTRTWFNNGWIKYGLMLKAALEAKWSEDRAQRYEANKRFQDLFGIVTSPYTESFNEIKLKAEEVHEWLAS